MASKATVDRQRSADSVVAVADAHAEGTEKTLVALVKPHLKKGEPAPAFAAVMRHACQLLAAARDHMVEKDDAHELELADDPPIREARDKAASALYGQIVEIREMLTGIYGAPTTQKILSGATPEDPAQLARFAGQIATNLLAAKLPAPRVKGAHLDVEALAADLRAKRAQVDKLLKDVQREVREAQGTLAEKTAAIASYDQVFAGVAGTLSGLLLLSGQAELASRVRPSTRRPGQTAEEAGDEPAPADKPEEK